MQAWHHTRSNRAVMRKHELVMHQREKSIPRVFLHPQQLYMDANLDLWGYPPTGNRVLMPFLDLQHHISSSQHSQMVSLQLLPSSSHRCWHGHLWKPVQGRRKYKMPAPTTIQQLKQHSLVTSVCLAFVSMVQHYTWMLLVQLYQIFATMKLENMHGPQDKSL